MTSATPCPEWFHDIPSERESEFVDLVAEAIERIENHLRHRDPLDSDLMDLHLLLFTKFVPLKCYAGNFRQDSIEGSKSCLAMDVGVAGISGASFVEVEQKMTDLSQCCAEMPKFVQSQNRDERATAFSAFAAYVIGEFIRIHPFINGNGRVSRLLWYWLCRRAKVSRMVQIHPRPPSPVYSNCMRKCMEGDDAPLALALLKSLARLDETPARIE